MPALAASHDHYLVAFSRLALKQAFSGELPKMLEEAMEDLRKTEAQSGAESMAVVHCRMKIATLLAALDRDREAMEWGEKGVGLQQKLGELTTIDYGIVVQRLGDIYMKNGEYMAAHHAFTKSYEVLEKTLDPKDPILATTVMRLGEVAIHLDLPEKRALLTRALAMQSEANGATPEWTGRTAAALAGCCFFEKDIAACEIYSFQALELLSRKNKDLVDPITRVYRDLIEISVGKKQFAKADAYLKEAEELIQDHAPVTSSCHVWVLQSRGLIHSARGEYAAAEMDYLTLLDYAQKMGPSGKEETFNGLVTLAATYEKKGNVAQAERTYMELRDFSARAAPPDWERAAYANGIIGIFLLDVKHDSPGAERYLRAAAAIRVEKMRAPVDPSILMRLADICAGKKQWDEARAFARQTIDSCTADTDPLAHHRKAATALIRKLDSRP
jgi:hypothetical protein